MSVYSQDLETLRATIREIVSQPSGSQGLTDAAIDRFINIAQVEICKFTEALTGSENPSIVASTAAYSLPADWLKTITIQYQIGSTEFRFLHPISRDDYLRQRTITTSSFPDYYSLFGGDIYIYPTPTGSSDKYLHFYVKQPDELASDADIPYNAEERLYAFHQEIADLAINLIRVKQKGLTSEEAMVTFRPRLEAMKQKINLKHRPSVTQIKRSYPRSGYRPPFPSFPSNY